MHLVFHVIKTCPGVDFALRLWQIYTGKTVGIGFGRMNKGRPEVIVNKFLCI